MSIIQCDITVSKKHNKFYFVKCSDVCLCIYIIFIESFLIHAKVTKSKKLIKLKCLDR